MKEDLFAFVFRQICDDSVDPSVFFDAAYIGVGMLIGFMALAALIKPLGRRTLFGWHHRDLPLI